MQLSTSHLSQHVDMLEAVAPAVAGATDVTGATIDLQNAFGAFFGLKLGTITDTSVGGLKIQQSEDDSTWADITSATKSYATTGDSNKWVFVDVRRPSVTMRYVRAIAERATANAVVELGTVVRYQLAGSPTGTTASASVVGVVNVP